MANQFLYQLDNYSNTNIDFIISTFIREYDISKANISILYSKGLISKSQYLYYYNLQPTQRKVAVGCLQRDNPEINKGLTEGFKEYRKLFFESNGINDGDVLAIKKDAIFLIEKKPSITEFDAVKFTPKNVYTSFYRFDYMYNHYEMYYLYDGVHEVEQLDVKGIGKAYKKHEGYMNEFLKCIFECAENGSIEEATNILSTFLDSYINRLVDYNFYREYTSASIFRLRDFFMMRYQADVLDPKLAEFVDDTFNRKLIETLLSYYSILLL